jgi:O-antigen ligase
MTASLPVIAAGLWLVAFISSFPWISAWEPEFLILMLISLISALAFGLAAGIENREWPIPRSGIMLAGGAFWLLALVSVVMSDLIFVGWVYFCLLSVLPISILLFLTGPEFGTRLRVAGQGLKIILGGLALMALYQYFLRPDLLFAGRVHEPLTDPNGLAATFSLGIFMVGAQFLTREKSAKATDIILLFLLSAAFLAAGSRGGFIALAVMGGVGAILIGRKNIPGKAWMTFGGIAAGALLITALITPEPHRGPLNIFLSSLRNGLISTLENRFDIWSSTWRIIQDHPWFGTGIGTFVYYYPEVRAVADTSAGYMAHNDPLQFGAEMGVGAILLFYVIVILGILRTVRAVKRIPAGDDRRIQILAPALALGALVLHSHLTFNFHVLPCLMLAGYVFALWYHATAQALDESPRIIKAPAFLNDLSLQSALLIVAFIVMTVSAAPVYTQRLVQQAGDALRRGDIDAFAISVNLADTLSLGMKSPVYVMAAALPMTVLAQKDVELDEIQKKDLIAQADDLLSRARRTNPRDADVLFQQALLEDIKGDARSAEDALAEALRINPLHLKSRLLFADHLGRGGREEEEINLLMAGICHTYHPEQRQDLIGYYMRTIVLLEARGRKSELEDIKARLARILP